MDKRILAVVLVSLFGSTTIAGVYFYSPGTLPYADYVAQSVSWISGHSLRGSTVLVLTDQSLASDLNATHRLIAVFDPSAASSSLVASYKALTLSAVFLVVTNLEDDGGSYALNFAWRSLNSSTLYGAVLSYSNPDVRVFCVVASC